MTTQPATTPDNTTLTPASTPRIVHVTMDCRDALAQATFWAAALGKDVDDGASPFFATIGRGVNEPALMFAAVDESKTVKNRLHMDLESTDPAAEVQRLVELGASIVSEKAEWGHEWTILRDPESNEFCLSGPHA